MSLPVMDDFFSTLSDDEASYHEDASENVLQTNNSTTIQNNNYSFLHQHNIKYQNSQFLRRMEYDIWAMEMEHYMNILIMKFGRLFRLEIQRRRNLNWKDGGVRYFPPASALQEILAVEKEKELNHLYLWPFAGIIFGKHHVLKYQLEMQNHKFLRSLPQHWVFEHELTSTSKSSASAQNVAFVSHSKSSNNKVKSGHTDLDLLHEDLEQIDDLDIEEMDINWQIAMIAIRMKKFYKKTGRRVRIDGNKPVGFDKKKLECFKCHNTGHFARECTSKGTNDGKKRDSFYQDQGAGKKEQNQNCLLTMDDGVVNWGEHTVEEVETNHALMAISSNNEVSLCSKTCIDSYNKLKTLCDEQTNQLGEQEAKILAYNQAVKKLEAQIVTFQKQQLSLNEQLTFQANELYEKDEKLKKYRRIGMKAVKEKEQLQKIVDSWKDSSKNLWKLVNSGMTSNSKVGLGYGIKSNNEVLSYEEEMNCTVFNCTEEDFVDKPLYNRFSKTDNFKGVPHPLTGDYTPKPQQEIDESLYVYGKKGPQKHKTSVSDDKSNEHSTCQSNEIEGSFGNPSEHSSESESESIIVLKEMSTSKSVTTNEKVMSGPKPNDVEPSCSNVNMLREKDHPLKNMEDRGIFDSGCSTHMTGNKDHLDDFEECKGGFVTFGGNKGYITGKGRVRVGNLEFDSVSFVKELKQTKLTMGKAIVKLVKKVKKIEVVLKRRHVVLTDSEDEDTENSSKQGRNLQDGRPTQGKLRLDMKGKLDADEVSTGVELILGFIDNKTGSSTRAAKVLYNEDGDFQYRTKLEANRDLSSKVLSIDFSSDDFAKKTVELINEKKKLYKEQRERERDRRNIPMTQAE
ncbi:ribonuclease H-like domain-containing protein [Tanacetum coccineum]